MENNEKLSKNEFLTLYLNLDDEGKSIVEEILSNPYGIATLFKLTSDETKSVVPIARALIGNRSAVRYRSGIRIFYPEHFRKACYR